ncbi:DUF7112 family protein [Halobellus limi]|uniref:Uncharacterized protein n=1 Tax=Halobellus limi TaxID=699433 RepID=A0A1H6CLB3_9EURY|nr:hypothetical protein [Halobellus limi]QCC48782.1 hypothetical protein DV707_14600 [Halobellus limi]SEG73445.1 hypothetical protein SAMN04488133_3501 [Halobellus limi]
MSERIPSDHASVTSLRATIARSGGTRRPCLRLPDDVAVEEGDVVRLLLDGATTHARVAADSSGLLVRGAYDNERLTREPGEGENRLVEWCADHDRGPDDAVELDELDSGFCYGLREPGDRVVYDVPGRPDQSLRDIASSFRE